MKVTAILKGRPDSQGRQTVYIRINEVRKRSFKATKLRLSKEQFVKGRVVNHPSAGDYNRYLRALILDAEVNGFEKEESDELTLYNYINTCLRQWDRTKKPGTLRQIRSQRDKLQEFAPALLLSEVTVDFLYRYQGHRYGEGNQPNTVWTTFKFLRSIIKKAYAEGLVKEDPFKVFKMPVYRDPQKVYLTKTEIERVDSYLAGDAPKELVFAGTWFLIACYTGLRLSDLLAFDRKKNIVGGRLIVHTVKTSDIVSLPITDRLQGYFDRVGYKPLGMTGENYNRLLKALMLGVGINKKVSSHTARHSAAIMMADAGMSVEVVARILGQKNIKITQVYYKITGSRIDEELKKMN
jgi:integrase/recombinase XerD